MKIILQNFKTGETELAESPCPQVRPGHLLIRTRASLVSAGTERMLLEFSQANLFEKARLQPDKVRQVWSKVRTDGLLPTLDAVRTKLDQPLPLGYCNAGVVLEVGAGVDGFAPGDRVVSNGYHAEVVCVPKNLCVSIPSSVSDEASAFTVVGAIALQGIRLLQPTLGESIAVIGLGLIGLMTIQLLCAHGCRVLGVDFVPDRLRLAHAFGAEVVDLSEAEKPVPAALDFSQGRGVDGVVITASTTSSAPVHHAAQMCRKRGRIVLVGVTGLALSRADFYKKELTFQVSCSYGPGRYDPQYEEAGQDYPVGFVRWTAQRNFQAVLDILAAKRLDVAPLVSHRVAFDEAPQAYAVMASHTPHLGIILQYPQPQDVSDAAIRQQTVSLLPHRRASRSASPQEPILGVIGAGNHTLHELLPAFTAVGVRCKTIASSGGISGFHAGRKFGFEDATTDVSSILTDPSVTTVVIATRHDSHATLACQALEMGKHVFVEKPLALTPEELERIVKTYAEVSVQSPSPLLMVGFNRRFAPHVTKMKQLLDRMPQPKSFIMTVNAGEVPPDHWTQDPQIGGGRIIGEGCHFIDLLRFLVGQTIEQAHVMGWGPMAGDVVRHDKVTYTLTFADGSCGTIHYLANGHKTFPKERLEVFCAGCVLQLNNFRQLWGYGWPGFRSMRLWRQDKGHRAAVAAFLQAIREAGSSPIPFDELVEVTQVSFAAANAAKRKSPKELSP
jgi:predicted dehydrogenase/threonine dehydrogenase-like Zn-dependent dehydrogenase